MEKTLDIKGIDLAALFGTADAHLRLIERSVGVNVVIRYDNIKLKGNDILLDLAKEVIHEMKQTLARKGSLTAKDVRQLIQVVTIDNGHDNQVPKDVIHYGRKGAIVARSDGQHEYINIVQNNDIVLPLKVLEEIDNE